MSTSIANLVEVIVGKVREVLMNDIVTSEKLYLRLSDIYSQRIAYLVRGLADPTTATANLMSKVHLIVLSALISSSISVLPVELETVTLLRVDKVCFFSSVLR
jgi:hypothetical protein